MERGKSATRRRGFKEKMKDKQIKPSIDKDKVDIEEKQAVAPTEKEKMFFNRYGYWNIED